jgi:hypothetical protein
MKTQQTPDPDYQRTNLKSVMRITAFVTLVALIGIPLFSSSLASATSEPSRALPMTTLVRQGAAVNSKGIFRHFLNAGKQVALLPLSPALAETINIFAADCTTPKTEFFLGLIVLLTGACRALRLTTAARQQPLLQLIRRISFTRQQLRVPGRPR